MEELLARANDFFELRLNFKSRFLILIAVIGLLPVYFFPLWSLTFHSNQYTDGLLLHIYSYRLEGGKSLNRDDIKEINVLNHYIGMRPLQESDFSEFVWLPLCIGAFMLLALRAMVHGRMSMLIDVFVLFTYFGLFSLWNFAYRLYTAGHNLDPTAAIKVPPFFPPIFGEKIIGNFTVESYPHIGSVALLVFPILLLLAIVLSWLNPGRIHRSWEP